MDDKNECVGGTSESSDYQVISGNAEVKKSEELAAAKYAVQQEAVQKRITHLELELAKTKSELDRATVQNSGITKTAESLANQNRELTDELREIKLREKGLLNDISKLKQENVTLQKELRFLESANVDLKNNMEQEAKRFSEKLKNSADKETDLVTAEKELQAAREPLCPDRILLAVGGWVPDGELTGSIEAYDPKIRSWTKLNISDPNGPRASHGCVFLNGEMWTIGGYNAYALNSVRKLNLVTKQWSDCALMNHRRCDVSVAQHNGHIWAMGGFGEGRRLNSAERYDPNDDKWSLISPLSAPRFGAHATVCSDKIYIAGGYDGHNRLDSVEYYDAATDRWILLTARMKYQRACLGCASLDGVVYVVGGKNAQSYALSSAERYDPRTGRWDQLSDMPMRRIYCGIECVDGKIVVAGGHSWNMDIAECENYEPRTNSWTPLAPMNEKRYGLYCVAVERTDAEQFF